MYLSPRALERDSITQIVQSVHNHRGFLWLFAKLMPCRRSRNRELTHYRQPCRVALHQEEQ